jgi:hypothetical protein
VPAIGTAIMADVAYSTRTQLRSTYDLSVIHGAPLSVDDVEDCYLVFLIAMGVKAYELIGGVGKAVGPQVVAYNVRKVLRSGLRKALQEVLKKIGGTRLARKLTERAMMRLLVPGISVPIASTFNYYFTKKVLTIANRQMIRRGGVVQPVLRLYKREPELDKTFAAKVLLALVDAGDPEGWSEGQMDALRHCQSALSLDDADLAELEEYFDRGMDRLVDETPSISDAAIADVVELAVVGAALYPDELHDQAYAEAIARLSERGQARLNQAEAMQEIEKQRSRLE